MSASLMVSSDLPLKSASPPSILPGGIGISRISVIAETDLPEPDSPTTPSVSPLSRSNETPSTALTTPSRVWKCILRS